MADDKTDDLELDEADAEKLLADSDDEPDKSSPDESATDERDWKAEAEKWKTLSRKNERTATERAAALKKYEDANKSDAERREERATTAESRAEKAEAALKRREIAEDRAPEHATITQIKAVAKRLAGESDDDLASDADELFALLAPAPATPKTPSRPKERLRGGAEPDDEPEESDPRKLAALIPRRQ